MQVEVVLLLSPGLEVLRLLLPLQHLQLRLPHGLLPLPLQTQLLHLHGHEKGFPAVVLVFHSAYNTHSRRYNTADPIMTNHFTFLNNDQHTITTSAPMLLKWRPSLGCDVTMYKPYRVLV